MHDVRPASHFTSLKQTKTRNRISKSFKNSHYSDKLYRLLYRNVEQYPWAESK